MNKIVIFISFVILFYLPQPLFSQLIVAFGTNLGGAVPTKMTENSSAKILPGGYITLGNRIIITDKIQFVPQISTDFSWFNYSASQKNDTIVLATVAGMPANIPTYYTANISGKIRLIGLHIEIPFMYSFSDKAKLTAGLYSSYNAYKSDNIDINVQIGEGGLLPDFDSSYNNKNNINLFDMGINIGGEYSISEKYAVSIGIYRSLSRFYKKNYFNDNSGNNIDFYYTQVRLGFVWRL